MSADLAITEVDSQPLTILIIDDTLTNLAVIVDHLEYHNFRVAVARNGKEGIKRAKYVQPALILLDVMMPEMNGFETCRRLKESDATKNIPVIFMTALDEAINKAAGYEAGGVDYITKPFKIAEVLSRINIHLTMHSLRERFERQQQKLQEEISRRELAESDLHRVTEELEGRVAQRTTELVVANTKLRSEIAERLQVEKALKDAREELENRVKERTAELSAAYSTIVTEAEERKQYEAILRVLNRAMASSTNGIVIINCIDETYPIEYVNPAFERMTGYFADNILGQNIGFLFKDDIHQPEINEIENALKNCNDCQVVLRHYRKDGTLFWNDLSLAPVRDETNVVTHFLYIMNDVTEKHRYEEELRRQATHDVLTGLPNRTLLLDRLNQAIAFAKRAQCTAAVAFLDLDSFKFINDSIGHDVGDELLLEVASRLKACVRPTDTVSRLGGDEFVLVFVDQPDGTVQHELETMSVSSEPKILKVLNRIINAISRPIFIGSRELRVTCSIGVSTFPHDGQDAESLLKNADVAMYRAKEGGRNNYYFYTSEMNACMADQLSMETLLRRALERNEFSLNYQPKIDLKDQSIAGIEVLLRWHNPQLGPISPANFIPILERTGLISDVGKWVIRQALQEQTTWSNVNLPSPRLAVNVSQVQLDHKNFVDFIKEVFRQANHSSLPLDLEITESLMMKNAHANIPKLKAIRAMGIGIAIDDFGTGYSSLSHLNKLPVNVLKIDREFIVDIVKNPSDRNIVYTIITLAHSMKLKVVAEGVETKDQVKILRDMKCDEIQGFVITQPLPLIQYIEWEKNFRAGPNHF